MDHVFYRQTALDSAPAAILGPPPPPSSFVIIAMATQWSAPTVGSRGYQNHTLVWKAGMDWNVGDMCTVFRKIVKPEDKSGLVKGVIEVYRCLIANRSDVYNAPGNPRYWVMFSGQP
ncbi:hypothetical protein ONZ45_g4157 [Pleurotus djamor]|nr:hypothetical protein ONZ45_g4157 [Pleurotus djamor]